MVQEPQNLRAMRSQTAPQMGSVNDIAQQLLAQRIGRLELDNAYLAASAETQGKELAQAKAEIERLKKVVETLTPKQEEKSA